MGKVTLNEQQRAIATKVLDTLDNREQLLMFITGRAGTGKSILIKYIALKAQQYGIVLNCAMTNQAAVKIGGQTLHRAFGWSLTRRAPNYAACAHTANLIIVDEVSMMSSAILQDMHTQLAKKSSVLFGGKSIILVGDFNQLPPVKAAVAYKSYLWEEFRANSHRLVENMRQREMAFDDACIGYMQRGTITDILASRIVTMSIQEITDSLPNLAKTKFLFHRNEDVDEQNIRVVTKLGLRLELQKSLIIAKRTKSSTVQYDGFYIGGHYVATENGACLIKGDEYTLLNVGEADATVEDRKHNRFRICQRPTPYWLNGKVASKRTLPIRLHFAMTVHMSQGASYSSVVVDPTYMGRQLFYVAISRCTNPEGLSIIGNIPQQPFDWEGLQRQVFGDGNL